MFDWLLTEIYNFLTNPLNQGIMALFGTLVVIGGFLKKFVKKKSPANPITDTKLSWFSKWFSNFPRRYNKRIIFEHRIFNVRGLRTQGTFTLKLEKVFVELRIAHSHNPQQKKNMNPIFAKELADNHPIWDFLRFGKRLKEETLVFAVIGAPGCGKTTLLQHIALIFASKQHRRHKIPAYVPLLLFLRQHVQTIMADTPALADLAHTHFSDTKKYPNLNPQPSWFAHYLNNGKCLILLDGLDEVADLQQRQKVSEWVDQQIVNYPLCRFIVTSRPQGYLTAPIERANVLEVQPFNAGQVRRFIHSWYLANEAISFGSEDEGVRQKARESADDLILRLRKLPALSALTVNPLLLTMIAMVHRYRGQLPGRRVELYAEICDVLLGHWQQGKGLQDGLTAAQKRVALQPLAAQMMRDKIRDICTNKALPIIKKPLKRVGLQGEAVNTFLNDVQTSSGLLLEREANVWSFAHLTFQEYLAAAYFLEQQTQLDWHTIVNDSWWHESLRLYAAQGDATRLVQACLDNNNVAALTLAIDCLEEARELDAEVRSQVEMRLIEDLESDDQKCRQLAAEVCLNKRLKSFQRIDEHREIDLDYITCAEYQLFLDEKKAEIKYYQPDHWTKCTFPKNTAQEPIRGIRAEDAMAFCEWLTQKQRGESHYRLPESTEMTDYPSLTAINHLGIWCQQEGNFYLERLAKEEKSSIFSWAKGISSSLPFDRIDLSRDLALDRDPAIALDRDFGDLAIAIGLDLASTSAIDRDLDFTFVLASTLDLDHNHVIDRAFVRAYTFALDRADLVKAIEDKDFDTATQLAQAMQDKPHQQRLGTLLYEILSCVTATTDLKARQAWRQYMARIAEYSWIGYNELEQLEKPFWWKRWLFRRKVDYTEDKEAVLNLYWWLQVVMAREKGELPAWEGIRIVRERKPL
ncbi:NACHT domain-containing protein [Candidatus Parabeggiatoa sp. HSG14]|uniref:NACHT domain-containing protein n=1 Tax=Candidatus Parabeggiatoa sp. HSG14 TaxID=3055593 RepID=UPI0025A69367|nr:NACHT domain-containing protein [Thiotrichales bacterium HSG14]